jgi:hypothetical protein
MVFALAGDSTMTNDFVMDTSMRLNEKQALGLQMKIKKAAGSPAAWSSLGRSVIEA